MNGGTIFTVCQTSELTVGLRDSAGELGKFIATATSCSARVLACRSYHHRFSTTVRVVTEDAEKTARALAAEGIACTRGSIVLIQAENSPAAVVRVRTLLALSDIPLLYWYCSWSEQNSWAVAFKTADDSRAAHVLLARASGAARPTLDVGVTVSAA